MKVFILVGAFLVSACGGGDSAATVSILTHEPKTPVSPPLSRESHRKSVL